MLGGQPVERIRRALLAPTSTAPVRTLAASRVVCNCLGVSERAIRDALPALPPAPDDALRVLQSRLGCGTSCGSCVPEVKRLLAGAAREAEAA